MVGKINDKLQNKTFSFAGIASGLLGAGGIFKILEGKQADFLTVIGEGLVTIIYYIFSWFLTAIDFVFLLVRQLCGLNTDFSSLENIAENDIIFKFILSENIGIIIKNLVMFAVVIILVLSIIAIIKSEFSAIADDTINGEIKNAKGPIWKKLGESLLLLVLVPIVTFGAMIMTNAVLQSLYNVTASSNNMTIGGQIFSASTFNANAYRAYAKNNRKIPITYNFNQLQDYSYIYDWDSSGSIKEISETLEKYKNATVWTQGYATFEMFYYKEFFQMSDIDKYQLNDLDNVYNLAYDTGIYTYSYEYLANADLLDYLMSSGLNINILTLEEVYKSCVSAGKTPAITPMTVDGEGNYVNITDPEHQLVLAYQISVHYNDGMAAKKYISPAGAYDEADGAVFVACIESSTEIDGVTKTYYEPICKNNSKFNSDVLEDADDYLVFKGVFDSGKYPTAIKKVDGAIKFYRDNLNVPTYSNFFPHISYEWPSDNEVNGVLKVMKGAIEFMTGIDISKFVPYIYIDIDLMNLFNKSTMIVGTLNDASYYVDYRFSAQGVDISCFYQKLQINIIILIMASSLIIGQLIKALFGVMKRSVDVMFLFLIYPAAVSTIPLYGKSSFGNWVKEMVKKLFALYGLVICLNLSLMLVPLSTSFHLFTAADIANSTLPFLNGMTSFFANKLVQLLFLLVGISFIFSSEKAIMALVTNSKIKDAESITESGGKVISGTTDVFVNTGKILSGAALIDAAKSTLEFVPGSAIVKDATNTITSRVKLNKTLKNIEMQRQEAKKVLMPKKEK